MNAVDARGSSLKGNLMIIAATIIWGSGYAVKLAGMEFIGPITFNAARFFIGGFVTLIPTLFYIKRQKASAQSESLPISKSTIKAGLICGAILTLAINLQQAGLARTTVANASFLTTLYVIIVPIAMLVFFKKRAPWIVWVSVIVAVTGVYFLSLSGYMQLNFGDVLIMMCAVVFAAQILVISHFSPRHNVMVLACVQFFTVFILSTTAAFILETPVVTDIISAGPHVLYAGVLSSSVAYVLQMKAQKTTAPTVAAVLFSFEGVVAAAVGWVFLHQILSAREILGCALIFVAILLAQRPQTQKSSSSRA